MSKPNPKPEYAGPPRELVSYEVYCADPKCPYSVMHEDLSLENIKKHHTRWNKNFTDHRGRKQHHHHVLIFRQLTKEEAKTFGAGKRP